MPYTRIDDYLNQRFTGIFKITYLHLTNRKKLQTMYENHIKRFRHLCVALLLISVSCIFLIVLNMTLMPKAGVWQKNPISFRLQKFA